MASSPRSWNTADRRVTEASSACARAERIGATFSISSDSKQGTLVEIVVPDISRVKDWLRIWRRDTRY